MKVNFEFKNLSVVKQLKDESFCKKHLEQVRWNGHVSCIHCGNAKVYRTNRGFVCSDRKGCRKKFSVISGTIFENTKLPLSTWYMAIYLVQTSKKGISSLQMATQLGISQKTSWFLLHRIRFMMKSNFIGKYMGDVQVDETYVGGALKNKHKSKKTKEDIKKQIPVVGILQSDGTVRTFVVKKPDATTLHKVIEDNVEKNGSTVTTDAFMPYVNLRKKYTHVRVNHKKGEYVVQIDSKRYHTNGIENFWSIFKRGIFGIYHGVSPKHLHRYCSEFEHRNNNRKFTGEEKFSTAMNKCENIRLKYKTLIAA